MNKQKVYCGQCRWWKWQGSWAPIGGSTIIPASESCEHVTNTKRVDSHAGHYIGKAWTPAEKNANNDCPLQEPKPNKRGFWAWLLRRKPEQDRKERQPVE